MISFAGQELNIIIREVAIEADLMNEAVPIRWARDCQTSSIGPASCRFARQFEMPFNLIPLSDGRGFGSEPLL